MEGPGACVSDALITKDEIGASLTAEGAVNEEEEEAILVVETADGDGEGDADSEGDAGALVAAEVDCSDAVLDV